MYGSEQTQRSVQADFFASNWSMTPPPVDSGICEHTYLNAASWHGYLPACADSDRGAREPRLEVRRSGRDL